MDVTGLAIFFDSYHTLYLILMVFCSMTQEGIESEKLRALLGLYVVQIMVGII